MDRQEIQSKIKELENELSELREELNKTGTKVFKPKFGDTYYYICVYGEVREEVWTDTEFDKAVYALGNCFETREEAKFEVEKLKVIAELKRFAMEHNEPMDWRDENQKKYFICYDCGKNKMMYIDYWNTLKNDNIYFSSAEIAEQAIKTIGEERIKKYYLGVED